jgi:hypothetical protein
MLGQCFGARLKHSSGHLGNDSESAKGKIWKTQTQSTPSIACIMPWNMHKPVIISEQYKKLLRRFNDLSLAKGVIKATFVNHFAKQ